MLRRYKSYLDLLQDSSRFFDEGFDRLFELHPSSLSYVTTTKDGDLHMTIDLPGVKLEDLDVRFSGNKIFVRAKRGEKSLSHSFIVDDGFDLSTAMGKLLDGVLSIDVKKRADVSNVIPIT